MADVTAKFDLDGSYRTVAMSLDGLPDAGGDGDMTKAVYDTDNDGKVDSAATADTATTATTANTANAVAWTNVSGKPTLSTVATSGSYADLTNKPTIPTVPVADHVDPSTGTVEQVVNNLIAAGLMADA